MLPLSTRLFNKIIYDKLRCYSTLKTSKKWKSVVGLEIHAQIASNSKLFSGAKNSFIEPINTAVALLDASIPGTLPVLNRGCVEAGVKTALALSCNVNKISMFDRKHYFYADLPAGYQITQQRAPLASNGSLTFPVFTPGTKPYYKSVRLHQLQLEQDSGKSLHDEHLRIIRGVAQAVDYEIERQISVKENGGKIVNETRSWDATTRTTIVMRDKEVVQDYRFMPEPNLPPLHLNMCGDEQKNDLVNVDFISKSLPILPQQMRDDLVAKYKLNEETSQILVNHQILLKYFYDIINDGNIKTRSTRSVAVFLINDLLKFCHKQDIEIENIKMTSQQIGELFDMKEKSEVNQHLVSLIFNEMLESSKSPSEIAKDKNWTQITDDAEIERICNETLMTESGKKITKVYKSGKKKVLFALIGEIMKRYDNKIDAAKVAKILQNLLEK
ncbi:CLUMA_CG019123, isoform A [Clunio marinus]|uniref:CLUMA_CG019123, isoform A n=1 Tax=Clunio marinus TaxID=568069 RepID=A0A1J1J137_9DIPT|nr:CLUMA_CG019123, isoform A [Clunio marinus]